MMSRFHAWLFCSISLYKNYLLCLILCYFIAVISLGFDLSNEHVKDTPILSVMGYLLHPGNVIFGPWISYQYYIDGMYHIMAARAGQPRHDLEGRTLGKFTYTHETYTFIVVE